MSDTRALANFVKMAHLRNCGSNLVADCGEECGYEKDMAFHQLGNLTERLAAETQRANEMATANEQWLTKWKATSDTYSNLLADARRQALQECLNIASEEGSTSVIENRIYSLIAAIAPSAQAVHCTCLEFGMSSHSIRCANCGLPFSSLQPGEPA